MAARRGLFESLQSEINIGNQDDSDSDSDNGDAVSSENESSGEEFIYEFPDDDDLPEPCDSDEEYVLTELGPVAYQFSDSDSDLDNDQVPSTIVVDDDPITDYISKDGTNWSKIPLPLQKTPARNVFKPPKTVLRYCETVTTPCSSFSLFLTDSMVADIVKYTNLEGDKEDKDKWVPTDAKEILALVGCLIHLGAKNMHMFPLKLVFDKKSGESIIRCAFNQNRFYKLCNRLRFDDKSSRNQRRERDLFAPFRDMWEKFLLALKRHYIPGLSITVDEQLVPWRGRCSFLQYLPSKPDKYGLKIFWAVDSETFYPLNAIPYLGNVGRNPTVNLGRNTALELIQPFYRSGRNLTCDNFFTDYELAQKLNNEKMSVVGTLRRNKKFIPGEFQDPKLTEKGQPKFCFRKDATLVSYKSGAKKNAILLSSMHSDNKIVTNKHKKELPQVVDFYNSTKGGVDTMDLMAHTVSTKRQTKRWPMVMFYNILDVGSIAASVVYTTKFPDEKISKTDHRREFQMNIAKDLILPQIERRRKKSRLPKQLTLSMDLILGNDPFAVQPSLKPSNRNATPPTASKRKRCARCPGKLDKKTSVYCDKCTVPICKEHSVVICSLCKSGI